MDTSTGPAEKFKLLWAKSQPRHALWKHLLDVSAVSMALPSFPSEFGLTDQQVAFLVGLHDVGKADSCFQHKVPALSLELVAAGYPITGDAPCRHERISADFVRRLLEDKMGAREAAAISLAVAAHHGHWDPSSRGVGRQYEEAQRGLCATLQQVLRADELPGSTPPDLSAFGVLLAGRVVLCDWVASNERFLADPRLAERDDFDEYFAAAAQVARDWVSDLGFDRSLRGGVPHLVVDAPRPIQQLLLDEEIPPGLVIVEAPMGEGKTEAAWILAEKWRGRGYQGTYMALPTMATSDSLHARYRDGYLTRVGEKEDVQLVHGMAWLRDKTEPDTEPEVGDSAEDRSIAAAWFRPTRRAILAAHGVGTIDQAMLAGMNVKFGFLRLYGLADRVLVIDEIHAYDAYMSEIVARLLRWCACLKMPVVLLSATLSAAQRSSMVSAYGGTGDDPGAAAPYPLITVVEAGQPVRWIQAPACHTKRLRIERLLGALENATATAAKAAELVCDGGCCCVVVNTVKQAQAVYQALQLPQEEKLLFHARFTGSDRQRTAERVLDLFGKSTARRPFRFVLVATQVVEQSLDVDFDYMISDIAPVDLLLQRSGRLHRHRARDCDPCLHVLVPAADVLEFGGTGFVYEAKPLLRTVAMLSGIEVLGGVRLPQDFRDLIDRCYGVSDWDQEDVPWELILEADQEWQRDTQLLQSQARQFVLGEPQSRSFCPVGNDPVGDDSDDGTGWRAKTRLGAADRTAVLVTQSELLRLAPGEVATKDVRALYRRSVKLPGYLPVGDPAPGYSAGEEAEGRLRGLLLLPVDEAGVWKGIHKKGGCFEVRYDETLGLLVGRAP